MSIKKGTLKRMIAGVLGALTVVSAVPTSAFAASGNANIVFSYVYQSNGSQILYQDSFTGTHGSDEPGASLHTGDTLTANASETWNNLGTGKQNAVKMALAFGKPGNAGALSGSGDAKHVATQLLVWEFVCGYRDTSSYERTNSSIYNALCKGGANS